MFSASKSGQYQGYQISRSVRLRSSASAYFNRTFGTPTNNLKWTWSGWAKLGLLTASGYGRCLFVGGDTGSGNNTTGVFMNTSNKLYLNAYSGGVSQASPVTDAVFRDPSAWYHVVCVYDSANATQADRFIFYVNNVRQTVTGTLLGLNLASKNNASGAVNRIGMENWGTTYGFDGYLTEINFIDGQALTPSSFGVFNAYGVWSPIKYNGTYGNNGFYLNFSDNSSNTATTIGKDSSGNGNNWTPTNISVTAGVTYDSMLDVPTPWADGGNGRGNYATLNPLDKALSGTVLSNGNLTFNSGGGGASFTAARVTMSLSAADLSYWECVIPTTLTYWNAGVMRGDQNIYVGAGAAIGDAPGYPDSVGYRSNQSKVYQNGTVLATDSACSAGNIVMFAYNASTRKLWVGRQGTWLNSGNPAAGTGEVATLSASYTWFAAANDATTQVNEFNFGQRPFTYTPPSGFRALNTFNLPEPSIDDGRLYMAATTYTGTGASLSVNNTVNNASFQPDFVWVKGRSGATDHALYDAVRGVQLQLESNTTTAETTETTGLTAFNSNGFTVGALAQMNTNTATYVGWQWNAGGSNTTNTSGTITSTVRASTTAGFSIVTYTGTGANATVGHGLGIAPKMVIVKGRSIGNAWGVWHSALAGTEYLILNTTAAKATAATLWNSTVPTSSVFSLGTDATVNANGSTYVAYCFAQITGFSAFGSYTGNGSTDGPFVFCGFRPRWVMVKMSSSTGNWTILDTAREGYNVDNDPLFPNLANAEGTTDLADILSNGFKVRTTDATFNTNTGTYMFAAFAENPFKYSLAR